MDSAKRKRTEFSDEIPEERLFKKFEVLESRLEQLNKLWTNDSNKEDSASLDSLASVADVASYTEEQTGRIEEIDDDDDGDNYDERSFVEELPNDNTPVEEIYLSEEELSNIWETPGRPEKEPPEELLDQSEDEDIVFLNEKNGFSTAANQLHPDIRETWTVWTRKGIPLKDRQDLLNKYAPPKFLRTPQVNSEILVTLHKRPIEKDEFVRSSQELVSSALTALGGVMSTLLTENEYDKLKVLNSLNDTAKILTDLFHFDTDKRRSNIISWKPQAVQSLLASTKPDEYLFGKNLRVKINEAQNSGRMGQLKPYVFKRNNNRPYKYFPSPYHFFGTEEEEKDDKDFVLNPLKQEAKDAKFVCKLEKIDKVQSDVKLE